MGSNLKWRRAENEDELLVEWAWVESGLLICANVLNVEAAQDFAMGDPRGFGPETELLADPVLDFPVSGGRHTHHRASPLRDTAVRGQCSPGWRPTLRRVVRGEVRGH